MSAKKSWDVERKPARAVEAKTAPRPPREARQPVRHRTAPQKKLSNPNVITRPHRRPTVSSEPLRLRRARAKKFFYIGVAILGVVFFAGLLFAAWMPSLRVSTVVAEGPSSEAVKLEVERGLQATHLFVVPRNSLFFIPEYALRKTILRDHPEISAVSFKSNGLTGLRVISVERTSAFLWCGVASDAPGQPCFKTDTDGLIFAPFDDTNGAAPVQTSLLRIFAPLEGQVAEPVGAHMGYASLLPKALRLAKTLRSLGADVTDLAIRGDEADFYTKSGTRITYVIGKEKEAAQLAASVFPTLKLNDASVEYVDLRFEGKVFLRKTSATQ